jgi:thiosulfate/3-mercaptopyruvate sulfurtransferase
MDALPGVTGPLVDVTALARALAGETPPVLLDVRWRLGGPPGLESYQAGHLPGAVFTDLDQDLSGEPGAKGRHPLPAPADFQAAMRRLGVTASRPVVVYDDAGAMSAARAWWLLRYFGHPRTCVLDGGYRAWTQAGREVERGSGSQPAPGDFTARPGHMPLAGAEDAARLAREGVLLDARAAERYRGEVEPVDPVAGHIPGAVSAPTSDNVDAQGRFLAPAALRARFAALGIAPSGEPPSGEPPSGERPSGELASGERPLVEPSPVKPAASPEPVPSAGLGGVASPAGVRAPHPAPVAKPLPTASLAHTPGPGSAPAPGSAAAPSAAGLGSEVPGSEVPGAVPDPGPASTLSAAPASGGRTVVGAYCGSGVTAAHEVLALELAGIPAVLYAGSWSHWVTDPSRPVTTGPEPG